MKPFVLVEQAEDVIADAQVLKGDCGSLFWQVEFESAHVDADDARPHLRESARIAQDRTQLQQEIIPHLFVRPGEIPAAHECESDGGEHEGCEESPTTLAQFLLHPLTRGLDLFCNNAISCVKLLAHFSKPSFAGLIYFYSVTKLIMAKIGPQDGCHVQFGISQLPK